MFNESDLTWNFTKTK